MCSICNFFNLHIFWTAIIGSAWISICILRHILLCTNFNLHYIQPTELFDLRINFQSTYILHCIFWLGINLPNQTTTWIYVLPLLLAHSHTCTVPLMIEWRSPSACPIPYRQCSHAHYLNSEPPTKRLMPRCSHFGFFIVFELLSGHRWPTSAWIFISETCFFFAENIQTLICRLKKFRSKIGAE